MGLNLDWVGKETGAIPFACGQDNVILYALGIGTGGPTVLREARKNANGTIRWAEEF